MVVYSASSNGIITKMASKMPHVKYYIPMKGEDEVDHSLPSAPVVMQFDEVLKLGEQALNEHNNSYYLHKIDLDKMCAIIFTSGTTGTSKGVMLSMRNLVAAADASCKGVPYDFEDAARFGPPAAPHVRDDVLAPRGHKSRRVRVHQRQPEVHNAQFPEL